MKRSASTILRPEVCKISGAAERLIKTKLKGFNLGSVNAKTSPLGSRPKLPLSSLSTESILEEGKPLPTAVLSSQRLRTGVMEVAITDPGVLRRISRIGSTFDSFDVLGSGVSGTAGTAEYGDLRNFSPQERRISPAKSDISPKIPQVLTHPQAVSSRSSGFSRKQSVWLTASGNLISTSRLEGDYQRLAKRQIMQTSSTTDSVSQLSQERTMMSSESATKVTISEANSKVEILRRKMNPNTTTELVIFDKDGTLTECDRMFGEYLVEIVDRLTEAGFYSPKDLTTSERVLDLLFSTSWMGYNRETQKFHKDSPIIRKTKQKNFQTLVDFQIYGEREFGFEKVVNSRNGLSIIDGVELLCKLNESLSGCEPKYIPENVVGCGDDVKSVLEALCTFEKNVEQQKSRIRCAVCTLDDRVTTKWMMEVLFGKSKEMSAVSNYIDTMSCIDDLEKKQKPDPYGILQICNEMEVPANKSIMVGDSITDMQAGIRAGCKAVIFVESGGLNGEEIKKALETSGELNEKTTFHIRKDVGDILDLI